MLTTTEQREYDKLKNNHYNKEDWKRFSELYKKSTQDPRDIKIKKGE